MVVIRLYIEFWRVLIKIIKVVIYFQTYIFIVIALLSLLFLNVMFPDHWLFHTGFLMRNKRFLIKFSTTILTLDESFFHKSIKRSVIKPYDIFPCDFIFCQQLMEPRWSLRTRPTLFRRFMILLVFPFLLTCFDMNS